MFLAWNGIILGNIINEPGALDSGLDPIAFLQSQGIGGESLGVAVSTFSELAIITSFIGFIYGLLDALTDAFKLPLQGAEVGRVSEANEQRASASIERSVAE